MENKGIKTQLEDPGQDNYDGGQIINLGLFDVKILEEFSYDLYRFPQLPHKQGDVNSQKEQYDY